MYFCLLAWTMAWFFALGNPTGVQGEFALAFLALLAGAVYKIYVWTAEVGRETMSKVKHIKFDSSVRLIVDKEDWFFSDKRTWAEARDTFPLDQDITPKRFDLIAEGEGAPCGGEA